MTTGWLASLFDDFDKNICSFQQVRIVFQNQLVVYFVLRSYFFNYICIIY